MKNIKQLLYLVCSAMFLMTSCDKEEALSENGFDGGELQGLTKYVITATPVGTTGIADYLLTADDLDQGSITTAGNGIEQDGSYRYYVTHKGKFFSLLYGQGNPGAVTTYRLNKIGGLVKTSDFQTETVQVFTKVNDDLLLMKVPRSGNEFAAMFRISADSSRIVGEKQVNIVELAGNGERAHFTWATQVGDKVFAPYMSIKGCCSDAFGTAYPDSAWVAVFSYPDLKLEKVIRDNRTSFIGAYFTDGMAVVENGDVYAFSPSSATNNSIPVSTKPSAFIRILKGTTEFDKSYFFNVQEISGGHHISTQTYMGNGKFLLMMYGDANALTGDKKMALIDVYEKNFSWVKGAPDHILSSSAAYNNNTVSADGKMGYIGLNTADGSWVYKIDIATATATRGLKVDGGKITAITKMDY
ncbi:DUF4374 domain-containing protein [Chitinophaga sp. MM2321]|uniref:DUF4374 domain-containing protein n=1 Tax=Chitinophaga sp. MM2321 TaxID=3137178 RepID=UPI0032D585E7